MVFLTGRRTSGHSAFLCRAVLNTGGKKYRFGDMPGTRVLKFDGHTLLIARGSLRLLVKIRPAGKRESRMPSALQETDCQCWVRLWKRSGLKEEHLGFGSALFVPERHK